MCVGRVVRNRTKKKRQKRSMLFILSYQINLISAAIYVFRLHWFCFAFVCVSWTCERQEKNEIIIKKKIHEFNEAEVSQYLFSSTNVLLYCNWSQNVFNILNRKDEEFYVMRDMCVPFTQMSFNINYLFLRCDVSTHNTHSGPL